MPWPDPFKMGNLKTGVDDLDRDYDTSLVHWQWHSRLRVRGVLAQDSTMMIVRSGQVRSGDSGQVYYSAEVVWDVVPLSSRASRADILAPKRNGEPATARVQRVPFKFRVKFAHSHSR